MAPAKRPSPPMSSSAFMSDPRASKKPRFDVRNPSTLAADAPEEDAILDLDEIGRGPQTKRSAVNIDGYESDSSTENFDTRAKMRAEEKLRAEKNNDEDGDDDMFAELDEDEEDADVDDGDQGAATGKEGKKAVRFLDVEDIDGQISSSKGGGHVSADFRALSEGRTSMTNDVESSSEDGSDGERDQVGSDVDAEIGAGGKKKHAPKLDAFNMRQEGEDGKFDESGNYVRKAMDPDAVHDSWLEGTSKKDMRKAKKAQEKREEERRKKDREQDGVATADLLANLIKLLHRGESVLEALQRLAKAAKTKQKPNWQQQKRNKKAKVKSGEDAMDVDADKELGERDPVEARRKRDVETITEAADQLLTRGQSEIYEAERELLMRQYRTETGDEWLDMVGGGNGVDVESEAGEEGGGDIRWEYRWSDARDGGEHHGPYDGATMAAWSDAGFFTEGVEFRRAGGLEWSRSVDFVR